MLDGKILTNRDRMKTAIESARDTVRSVRETIGRTEELIVQSRELLAVTKELRQIWRNKVKSETSNQYQLPRGGEFWSPWPANVTV